MKMSICAFCQEFDIRSCQIQISCIKNHYLDNISGRVEHVKDGNNRFILRLGESGYEHNSRLRSSA